ALERLDLAIATLASRLEDARVDELARTSDLVRAVGVADWHPHVVGALATSEAGPATIDPAHPQLAVPRAEELAARADEARARADAIPTPVLGMQAFATSDPGGVAVGAGITIPLPLFDRGQGDIAHARAEAHRAALEVTARAAELAIDLDRGTAVLASRRAALTKFETEALARVASLRTMAETAYRSGQGGIVELLDALDAITDARLRDLELRTAVAEGELAVRTAALGR
ncbi:MAG: TolC family protein, partial [Proteobacteria bacterium]|nr:TolC family protein [Pseudomonadota bacterium]